MKGRQEGIAVLPFRTFSDAQVERYFVDALTELLITKLQLVGSLRVPSFRSSLLYRDSNEPGRHIAEKLGVEYIVEASLFRSSDHIRLTVHLIHARTETEIWSKIYDHRVRDAIATQSLLANDICYEIGARISGAEQRRIEDADDMDPAVADLLFRGRHHSRRLTSESLLEAIALLEQAIQLDASRGLLYTELAEAEIFLGQRLDADQHFASAHDHINKAIELGDNHSKTYSVYGQILHVLPGKDRYAKARAAYERAVNIDPNNTHALIFLAQLIEASGSHQQAIEYAEHAYSIDQSDEFVAGNLIYRWVCSRRLMEAESRTRQIFKLHSNSWLCYWSRSWLYAETERYAEAISDIERAIELGGFPELIAVIGYALALWGKREDAMNLINKLDQQRVGPFHFVPTYVGLGDHEKALDLIDQAVREGEFRVAFWFPWYHRLRDNPRFKLFRDSLGLPFPS